MLAKFGQYDCEIFQIYSFFLNLGYTLLFGSPPAPRLLLNCKSLLLIVMKKEVID